MKDKEANHFLFYFFILASYGALLFSFFINDFTDGTGDSGLMLHAMIDNLQKLQSGNFGEWTNRFIFYPHKNTLAYTEHFYLHSVMILPFYLFSQNPIHVWSYVLACQILIAIIGFYFLSRHFTNSPIIAIIAGIYFAFLPTFLDRHIQISFYGFLPWMLSMFLDFLKKQKQRYLMLAALFLLLQCLAGIYLQLFTLFFVFLFLLVFVPFLLRSPNYAVLKSTKTLITSAVSLALLVVILFFVNKPYRDLYREMKVTRHIKEVDVYSPDLVFSYIIPNENSRLYFKIFSGLNSLPRPRGEGSWSPGFTGVLIFALSFARGITIFARHRSFVASGSHAVLFLCLLFSGIVFLFSLGPHLILFNENTGIRLPYYYLYQWVPPFRALRVTARSTVFLSITIGILILWWCERIRSTSISSAAKVSLIAGLSLLVFLDTYNRRSGFDASDTMQKTYIYEKVNQLSGLVLLELPSGTLCTLSRGDCNFWSDGYYMFTHIFHNKWTMNGYSGYMPRNSWEWFRRAVFIMSRPGTMKKLFQSSNISIVLLHKDRIPEKQKDRYAFFEQQLRRSFRVVYEDQNFLLIDTARD